MSIFSIVFEQTHYRTAVRLLSERHGVQARGGCACAGTYGHVLLGIDRCTSKSITDLLDQDSDADKPGWVRISFHPSMTVSDVDLIADAVAEVAANPGTDADLSEGEIPDIWRSLCQ